MTLNLVHFHFYPSSAHTYIHYMHIPQAGRMHCLKIRTLSFYRLGILNHEYLASCQVPTMLSKQKHI
ncbi:hypothetical protein Hanom_Chr12g01097391 [Helianthus anomalus]